MKKAALILAAIFIITMLCGCEKANNKNGSSGRADEPAVTSQPKLSGENNTEENGVKISIQIGGEKFLASPADTEAAREFIKMLREDPVTVEMRDYAGFEKVGSLGAALPADDEKIAASPGDIMLYLGEQIVLFYGTNEWDYTRLAHVDGLSGWADALGSGEITAVFSIEE